MKRNLCMSAALAAMISSSVPTAQAGGYSRSADEITASYMEGVVARVLAQTVFGKPTPIPLTSRCSIRAISRIKNAEVFLDQITFKERPRKCAPVLATNFSRNKFDVIFPHVKPCGAIKELLSRVLVDPKMGEIRINKEQYDALGLTNVERTYIFEFFSVDAHDFETQASRSQRQSLSRVVSYNVHDENDYCRLSVQTVNGGN